MLSYTTDITYYIPYYYYYYNTMVVFAGIYSFSWVRHYFLLQYIHYMLQFTIIFIVSPKYKGVVHMYAL